MVFSVVLWGNLVWPFELLLGLQLYRPAWSVECPCHHIIIAVDIRMVANIFTNDLKLSCLFKILMVGSGLGYSSRSKILSWVPL